MLFIEDLFLGIVAGLVAGLIGVFSQIVWKKILVPWFEDRVYKGAKIEGVWDGCVNYPDHTSTYTFYIKRQSHNITGQIVSKTSGSYYPFLGEFRKSILTLTYESSNPGSMDRGCLAFTLEKGGKELRGYGAYYHPDYGIINPQVILNKRSIDDEKYVENRVSDPIT